MFADQMAVFQIVMLGEELIEALDLLGRYESHGQMDENLLFIGSGLAKADEFFLFHAREGKKMPPGCPAKSFSPLFARDLPLRNNAPYPARPLAPLSAALGSMIMAGINPHGL